MNRVSNLLQSAFRCVAAALQRVALASAAFFATHCEVLRRQCVARSVAGKPLPTQWLGGLRHSATLLFFKIKIITYVHTYAYVHRGSIGKGSEVLRPRLMVSK